MEDDRKEKLVALGAESLAEALLVLSYHFSEADDLVERLIATPQENLHHFKRKIAGLKRARRFIHYRESQSFSRELSIMLQVLKDGVDDPEVGMELVASFFETDNAVFERCDDSGGWVGDVFRFEAKDLFAEYALRCEDKKKIASLLLKVIKKDDYGVRDHLFERASEFLPEKNIRSMVTTLQKRADKEEDEYRKRHHLGLIESLAKQIKDAPLYEKARLASWPDLSTAACIDIAEVYFDSGDVETAHSWILKIKQGETFMEYERDRLLCKIYKKQGNTDKLTTILFKQFRTSHSAHALQALLDVIGEEKRDEIVASEVEYILEDKHFSTSDAAFMIASGKIVEAEAYILKRAAQINGEFYGGLLDLAKELDAHNCYLPVTMIYRSLLIAILERGYTKAYPHGVRYLKKLDKLEQEIADWGNFDSHEVFKQKIVARHGLKRSFWSKYQGNQK